MADENTINTGLGTPEPASKIESGKEHARQAADDLRAAAGDLRSAAEAKVNELRSAAEIKANELRHRAEHAYDDVRTRARTLREDGETYVRDNPTRAVLTALGIGFVFGLMFRR